MILGIKEFAFSQISVPVIEVFLHCASKISYVLIDVTMMDYFVKLKLVRTLLFISHNSLSYGKFLQPVPAAGSCSRFLQRGLIWVVK